MSSPLPLTAARRGVTSARASRQDRHSFWSARAVVLEGLWRTIAQVMDRP